MKKKILVITKYQDKNQILKLDELLYNQTYSNFSWIIWDNKEVNINSKTKYKFLIMHSINEFDLSKEEFDYLIEINSENNIRKESFLVLLWNGIYSGNSVVATSSNYDNMSDTISDQNLILISKDVAIKSVDKQFILKNHVVNLVFGNLVTTSDNSNNLKLYKYTTYPRQDNYLFNPTENIEIDYREKKDKKTNVLFVFPWAIVGGADFFNLDLIKFLDKEKYNIFMVTTLPQKNIILKDFLEFANEVYDLPTFTNKNHMPHFLRFLMESKNIDILFISNSTMGYSSIPYLKSIKPELKVVQYIHNLPNPIEFSNPGFAEYAVKYVDLISETYTCNEVCTNQLIKDYGIENAQTVYIGVDHKKFNANNYDVGKLKEKYNVPKDKTIISFVAYLNPVKRPDLFLSIADKYLDTHKDTVFLLGGYGPLYKEVLSKHKKLKNKSQIKILGYISNPSEIYALSNAILICSTTEGLTLTTYESCSFGTPVISGDIGGQKELVSDLTGKLVPYTPENRDLEISNFISAIEEVLAKEKEIRKRAPEIIRKKFSIEEMGKKMNYLMDNISPNNNSYTLKKSIFLLNEYLNNYNGEYNYMVEQMYNFDSIIYNNNPESKLGIYKLKIKKFLVKYKLLGSTKNVEKKIKSVFNFFKNILKILVLIVSVPFLIVYGLYSMLKIVILIIRGGELWKK